MAFYIKPPSGNTRYEQLLMFCRKRIVFLQQVRKCEDAHAFQSLLQQADIAENSECLIEGTKKDRISHFCLRLVCAKDNEMSSFFIKAETQLFCLRFMNMNSTELVSLLKSTYRFVHKFIYRNNSRNGINGTCNIMKSAEDLHLVLHSSLTEGRTWISLIELYMNDSLNETIGVPFQYALSLIRTREVCLNHGIAFVPCAKLHQILASIFEQIVADGLKRAKKILRQVFSEDERILDLFKEVRHLYYSGCRTGSTMLSDLEPILCTDIDNLVQNFPPCMQNLHKALRQKHRLKHFSRIQYTLFLKEIGLPVHEAIQFWQGEYLQPPNTHSFAESISCNHHWNKDGRRYIYNIRHLYGLEGSRTNYKAHGCYAMQNCSLGYGEDGGCVFTSFDDKHLKELLTTADIPYSFQSVILDLLQNKKHQLACETYLKCRLKQRNARNRQHHEVGNLTSDKNGFEATVKMRDTCANPVQYETEPDIERTKKVCLKGNLKTNYKGIYIHRSEMRQPSTLDDTGHQEYLGNEREIQYETDVNDGCSSKVTFGELNEDVNIEKPIDFYFTYMQLLKTLQSV